MSDGFFDFSFGNNDDGVEGKGKRFEQTLTDGHKYRISCAWWEGIEKLYKNHDEHAKFAETMKTLNPKFTGCKRVYIPGVGKVVNKGPEFAKLAKDPPKTMAGTIIVVWRTDEKGNFLNGGADIIKEMPKVLIYTFSNKTYESLKDQHHDWPMSQHDIIGTCKDAGFHNVEFKPGKANTLAQIFASGKAPAVCDYIANRVSELSGLVRSEIARDMTLEQVREKLGHGSAGLAPAESTSADVDDLLANI